MNPVCVIVDAYGSGSFLPAAFFTAGLPVVHVRNRVEEHAPYAAADQPPGVIDVIDFDGDTERVLASLKPYDVAHVVAGLESGVGLADELATALEVPTGNGTALSEAKRDKAAMVEVLRGAGIRHARSQPVGTAREAEEFAAGDYPFVLKPLRGAGTLGVRTLGSAAGTEAYFAEMAGTTDMWGNVNETFLAQEFLHGDEYMVDTISARGEHRTIEVWRADKRIVESSRVYDLSALIPPDEPVWHELSAYVHTVLDAFGIAWGTAHVEVMLTERGPVLIEIGARLHGSIAPSITLPVYGSNLVQLTAAAFTAPEHFLALTARPLPHRATLAQTALICPRDGLLTALPDFRAVRELPSFHSLRMRAKAGPVRRTRDLLSSLGAVFLVHPEPGRVIADYHRIREMEDELYRVIT